MDHLVLEKHQNDSSVEQLENAQTDEVIFNDATVNEKALVRKV